MEEAKEGDLGAGMEEVWAGREKALGEMVECLTLRPRLLEALLNEQWICRKSIEDNSLPQKVVEVFA